jgi:hypothetical protein
MDILEYTNSYIFYSKICHALALMHKIPFENAVNPEETAIFSLKARQWLHAMPRKFKTDEMQKKFDGYFAGP